MQIKIHKGTHQIGGAIVEIKTNNARIIIDMGSDLPRLEGANEPLLIQGVTCGEPDCDAVFITHYHGDHVGMYESVLPSIPIYMGDVSKQIFATVQQTLKYKLGKGNPEIVADFKTFSPNIPIVIKDIKITPYSIDHSAFDAYMFLIEADGKRILHTGDFRMHGARGRKMPAVYQKFVSDIDILITEGTMLSRLDEKVMTEHELGYKAKQIMRDNKYVFALCSSTNIDTIAQFYNAAIANNRLFIVCDDFQLKILNIVTANSKSSLYNFDKQKIYVYGNNLHNLMSERGFCFLGRPNFATQIAMDAFAENTLIYSMWNGYLDKSHPAFDEYKSRFVQNAILRGSHYEYLHTSGHATAEQIKTVCDITKAKTVIPIHCESPEEFTRLEVGNVLIMHDGESLTV